MSLISSPSTSSNEARALMAQYKRDAIEAQIAGDVIKAKIARNSFRLVAWMDSIRPERLEIELFGYSAHEITRLDYERRAGQALCRGRKYVPPPAQGQAPKIEALVANSPSANAQDGIRSRRQRKPSIGRMIAAAERAGKNVTSITTPDGMTLHFGKAKLTDASNPWLDDLKVTKQ